MIKRFLDIYTANYQKARELDQLIMEKAEYPEWERRLLERSCGIRAAFDSNESIINDLKGMLSAGVDDKSAGELFELVRALYGGFYDDLYVMNLICEPLIKYYEEKQDMEKLIYLYAVMSFENFQFYGGMIGENNDIVTAVDYYKKVIGYAPYYDSIKDESIRVRIVTAYSNLIAPLSQYDKSVRKEVFSLYHDAHKLYENSRMIKEDFTHKDFLGLIDLGMLSIEANLNEMSQEDIREFSDIVERLKNDPDFDDEEGNLYRAEQSLAIYNKTKTVNEVIEEYIGYIKELPLPDYDDKSDEDDASFQQSINFFNCAWNIFELYDEFEVSKEWQIKYTDEFVDIVTSVLKKVPYKFMTATYNDACVQWFFKAEKYLQSFERKKALLFDMILCRQPTTCIHSLMVEKLSVTIAERMLAKHPEFFESVAIEEHRELIEFIGDCALMHDIGKCAIADVVNRQFRKLSDTEFDVIKMHPEKAVEILGDDSDFSSYIDVMLGHHKSYDGKHGYPASFDNRNSALAPVIDLISICDAMDAATDVYGRNYTKQKTFDVLFGELMEGRGTRYCPEIVDLIADDPELYEELKNLTENRRGGIYYDVYRGIMNMKS